MKADIKERWIKLLESGEYNLGTEFLYDVETDTHCPLGVLVEMALEDGVRVNVQKDFYNKTKASVDGSPKIFGTGRGNSQIYNWAGLDYIQANAVATENDKRGSNAALEYIKGKL